MICESVLYVYTEADFIDEISGISKGNSHSKHEVVIRKIYIHGRLISIFKQINFIFLDKGLP